MNHDGASPPPAGATPDAGEFSQVDRRPRWSRDDVRSAARELWDLELSRIDQLVSERDQNWELRAETGRRLVLKVAGTTDTLADVEMQQSMMTRMAASGVPVPRPVATTSGDTLTTRNGHIVWLVDFLPGTLLAAVPQLSDLVLTQIGRTVATMTNALDGFEHPAAHRWLQWDVQHARDVLGGYAGYVAPGEDRAAVDRALRTFDEKVAPRLRDLQRGVIHNDVNDYNLLVNDTAVTGVIDFGDAVHSVRINDLAVTCAYAMLGRTGPLRVLRAITEGYNSVRLLDDTERAVLPDLIMTRLATSVSISAYQASRDGADAYLRISEAPAWNLIRALNETTR